MCSVLTTPFIACMHVHVHVLVVYMYLYLCTSAFHMSRLDQKQLHIRSIGKKLGHLSILHQIHNRSTMKNYCSAASHSPLSSSPPGSRSLGRACPPRMQLAQLCPKRLCPSFALSVLDHSLSLPLTTPSYVYGLALLKPVPLGPTFTYSIS